MGRKPLGARPMTDTERKARSRAKAELRPKPEPEQVVAPVAPPAAAADFPFLKLIHLAMDPTRTSEWIVEKIGPEAALAFYQALGRAIDAARR
jgi:hypothetical protein